MQQSLKGRQKGHEHRGAFLITQCPERIVEASGQLHRQMSAPVRLRRRAWMINRQFQNRRTTCQLSLPIAELFFQILALQPLLLPFRKVRVLKRQPGQWRRLSI
ncbi:MAG: hypothetical protein HONDAALG_02424 [Gammaproteobacteria bacterium]|nr:hypothetical protein [Gammaproteobacteria bacterium]